MIVTSVDLMRAIAVWPFFSRSFRTSSVEVRDVTGWPRTDSLS
jgi:hypothetical protein